MNLHDILDLSNHGADTFVGKGPQYPWGGLYGGQIVAQALKAAALTIDPAFSVHSLRAYFIRRGDQERVGTEALGDHAARHRRVELARDRLHATSRQMPFELIPCGPAARRVPRWHARAGVLEARFVDARVRSSLDRRVGPRPQRPRWRGPSRRVDARGRPGG